MSNALILSAVMGLATIVWILYLYRKGKMKENFALFWLSISTTIVVISTFQDLLTWANLLLQAGTTTYVVLAAFIFLLIIVSIYYSVKISELTDQNKKIAQALAILQAYMKEIDANKTRSKQMKKIIDEATKSN